MTDLRKAAAYTKPGAIVPVNVQTTQLLVDALRQALAQPVDAVNMSQERVDETAKCKREWVGLTRLELDIATLGLEDLSDCYKAIEAKLKEKNT